MTTPSDTIYIPSECGKIIPATLYSTNDEKDEAYVENYQQHALLIEPLNNTIIETSRLQVKGNNIAFKANLGGFLQKAMTIARSLQYSSKST